MITATDTIHLPGHVPVITLCQYAESIGARIERDTGTGFIYLITSLNHRIWLSISDSPIVLH